MPRATKTTNSQQSLRVESSKQQKQNQFSLLVAYLTSATTMKRRLLEQQLLQLPSSRLLGQSLQASIISHPASFNSRLNNNRERDSWQQLPRLSIERSPSSAQTLLLSQPSSASLQASLISSSSPLLLDSSNLNSLRLNARANAALSWNEGRRLLQHELWQLDNLENSRDNSNNNNNNNANIRRAQW
ncbi:Cry [Drosophila busckii]|uniref:Cry n=1 Tax=Drosophila busckii TaxID=30019 RepID=A0A0M4EAE8_DROBS|nr:Cry [Drosophila busckii]